MEWNPTPPEHTVESDTVIWRYMDLPRFISMLSTSLWFTRAADFRDDPFEGFCDARHREFPVDEHGAGPLSRIGPTTVSLERMFAEGSYSNAEICRNARDYLYVNSWCLANESMAMWQIYGSLTCGVAVTSTVGQFQGALRVQPAERQQFLFGKIKYHDILQRLRRLRETSAMEHSRPAQSGSARCSHWVFTSAPATYTKTNGGLLYTKTRVSTALRFLSIWSR